MLVTIVAAVLFIAAPAIARIATPMLAGRWEPLETLVMWLRWPVAAVTMMPIVACLLLFSLPNVERGILKLITLAW
jgi:membrane protease YdiL (CAAX protease family)